MVRLIVFFLVLSGCATLEQEVTLIEVDGWKLGVYEERRAGRSKLLAQALHEIIVDSDIPRY